MASLTLELDRLGFIHRQVAITNRRQVDARQVSAVAVQDRLFLVARRVARLVGHVRLHGELTIRQAAGSQVHGGAELAIGHGRLEGHDLAVHISQRLTIHVQQGQGHLLAIFHMASLTLELDRLGFIHRQVAITNRRQVDARQVSIDFITFAIGRSGTVARRIGAGHAGIDGLVFIRR